MDRDSLLLFQAYRDHVIEHTASHSFSDFWEGMSEESALKIISESYNLNTYHS